MDGSGWVPPRGVPQQKKTVSLWRELYRTALLVIGVLTTSTLVFITFAVFVHLPMNEWSYWVIPFAWGVWARLAYKEFTCED